VISELTKKIEGNPHPESSLRDLIDGVAFEFAVAGSDPVKLGAVQADVALNRDKLVAAALKGPAKTEVLHSAGSPADKAKAF